MAEQTMTKKKGLKKGWRIVLGILAGLILLYAVLGVLPRRENYALANPMMKEGALPLLIAHGGGNKEFPDNTLEAFYNAYSVDKNAMMETDVSITRDGVVILSHDTTLDRKTNVTGRIIDWNYSDLMAQKVDFGYTNPTEEMQLSGERVRFTDRDGRQKTPADVEYPDGVTPRDEEVFLVTTLEELLAAFPQNRINVEIKQSGETGMKAMKEVLRLLEQYDAWDRVVLASFHDEIYEEYQRLQKAGEHYVLAGGRRRGKVLPFAGSERGCVLRRPDVRISAAGEGFHPKPGDRGLCKADAQPQPGGTLLDHQRPG